MGAALYTFQVRDPGTIRDDMLRCHRNGLIARGVPTPNMTPDSDEFVRAQALANELAVVESNCVIKADEAMPDTATGDALVRRAAPFGVSKRGAVGSVGAIVFSTSAPSLVATGLFLTDSANQVFEVTVGGTYSNGDLIPVKSTTLGATTNRAAGDLLRWQNAPAFAASTATVATGGFVNGADAEDDETFRARFYGNLQVAANAGGNWQTYATIAEASTPSVSKAFVWPALQGGATVHVAVVAAPTATNKNRDVAAATMSGIVVPYLQGATADHVALTTTTVTNVPVDIAFQLSLPDATTAAPPGPGGGWLDGSPWPTTSGTAPVKITAVTSTTVMTTDAATSPVIGVSRIAWLSPTNWTLYTATVIGVSGTSGAYVLTLDTPFVGITTGSYIFPQSVNQALYIAAIFAAFALMGPGEKSSNASALIRGFRHPTPVVSWPYTIGSFQRKALTDASAEVLAAEYIYRFDSLTSTALTGGSGIMTPQVPGAVTSAPRLYVPRNIGFYRS